MWSFKENEDGDFLINYSIATTLCVSLFALFLVISNFLGYIPPPSPPTPQKLCSANGRKVLMY